MVRIAVVGLGYVGLPLAVAFAKHYYVIGYDINEKRIKELNNAHDRTNEISKKELEKLLNEAKIEFTADEKRLKEADFVIICVPTPLAKDKKPDISLLREACKTIGRNLRKGATIIIESTVWPGLTNEICKPIIEKESGFKEGVDFFLAYSPERANPGDKEHTIETIVKVVAANNPETLEKVAKLYKKIVKAGIYKASSIEVAEAAKVIENVQRDINIALMNELSKLFYQLNIDFKEVLDAAATKWNFLRFKPGLVGGHCIPVDPHYLAYKAMQVGFKPKMILAGRETNDSMPEFVVKIIEECLAKKGKKIEEVNILQLGLTFKENVPDFRNSLNAVLAELLRKKAKKFVVYDPFGCPEKFKECYIDAESFNNNKEKFDILVLAVAHKEFLDKQIEKFVKEEGIIVDIPRALDKEKVQSWGISYLGL
ncbi:MAG: nucleotide sugar dehydrogenase [Candidatus Diapherotrites archaeon]|nr:nucleotide sugar dehydrogenase [Candidatus Diapherotrites archaeon]